MTPKPEENAPTKEEMWSRAERLGILREDGFFDLDRLDVLAGLPQCELEAL